MQDVEIIGMLKTYVASSLSGVGALKGASCQIQSIVDSGTSHVITFAWEDNDGNEYTSTLTLVDGADSFSEISDVELTDLSDGQVIAYDSSTQKWVNVTNSATVESMENIGDVEITSIASGQLLKWDDTSEKWVNGDVSFSDLEDTPTTVSGYGITDAYTKTETDTLLADKVDSATTLSGYGITDAYTKTETDTLLADKADSATTLSGYGVTDAYTKTETDTLLADKADSETTLSGYGITDAYTKTETDTLLDAKADSSTTLSGYGITDAYTQTETDSAITTAIEALDVSDTVVSGSYVTGVSETDGEIAVTREAADTTPTDSSTKMVTSGGVYTAISDAVGALDVTDTAVEGSYVTAVSETDGVISVTREAADTEPTEDSTAMLTSGGAYTAITANSDAIADIVNIYGSKNLIPFPYEVTSTTTNGITITVNDDGSITLDGTATAGFSIRLSSWLPYDFVLGDSYTVTSGGIYNDYYYLRLLDATSFEGHFRVPADGKTFTITQSMIDDGIYVGLSIANGAVIDNVTFYPMLRLASIEDDTYEPYAKTNYELTQDIGSTDISSIDDGTITGAIDDLNTNLTNYSSAISNTNLLDNPWFTVNQRGESSYSVIDYTVDRWKTNNADMVVTVNDGYITLTTSTASVEFSETITYDDLTKYLLGKTVTVSAISDGTLYSFTVTMPSSISASQLGYVTIGSFGISLYVSAAGSILVRVRSLSSISSEVSINLTCIKLEVGSVSTLENDTTPNYATELLKCQRYFTRYLVPSGRSKPIGFGVASATTEIRCSMVLPCVMRTTPTITISDVTALRLVGNAQSLVPSALVVATFENNIIDLNATVSGATANQLYLLCDVTADEYIDFSADL